MVYQVLRTPRRVIDRGGGDINSHVVVERSKDLLHMNRSILGLLSILGRAANDLACLHTTAGQQFETVAFDQVALLEHPDRALQRSLGLVVHRAGWHTMADATVGWAPQTRWETLRKTWPGDFTMSILPPPFSLDCFGRG